MRFSNEISYRSLFTDRSNKYRHNSTAWMQLLILIIVNADNFSLSRLHSIQQNETKQQIDRQSHAHKTTQSPICGVVYKQNGKEFFQIFSSLSKVTLISKRSFIIMYEAHNRAFSKSLHFLDPLRFSQITIESHCVSS